MALHPGSARKHTVTALRNRGWQGAFLSATGGQLNPRYRPETQRVSFLRVKASWPTDGFARVSISLQRGRDGKTCCNFITTRLKSVVITYGGFYDNMGYLTSLARCLYSASWRRWGLNASLAIVLCHQTADSIVTSVSNDIGDAWFEILAVCVCV